MIRKKKRETNVKVDVIFYSKEVKGRSILYFKSWNILFFYFDVDPSQSPGMLMANSWVEELRSHSLKEDQVINTPQYSFEKS